LTSLKTIAGNGSTGIIIIAVHCYISKSRAMVTSYSGASIMRRNGDISTLYTIDRAIISASIFIINRKILLLVSSFRITTISSTSIRIITVKVIIFTSRFSITRIDSICVTIVTINKSTRNTIHCIKPTTDVYIIATVFITIDNSAKTSRRLITRIISASIIVITIH